MPDITYYGDGEGNWVMRVWAEQCPEPIMFSGKCQGVKGHEGDHWCYSEDGSYNYDVQGELEPHEIAGGITPPGHDSWISPVEMADKQYRCFHEDTEVTDPELIARLNRGEIEDGESLSQPISYENLTDIELDALESTYE